MSRELPGPDASRGFGVLVPVKPPAVAKSRLAPLGDRLRRELVTAFATDTVAAALDCPLVHQVLVVTDDHALAATLSRLGAEAVPDGATEDLNGSLRLAAAEVARRLPGLRVAALCADLPALRPDELGRALRAVDPDRQSFVADAVRTGTTLLAAPSVTAFEPHFGPDSRAGHLAAGAVEIDGPAIPGLRQDVDTKDDLAEAIRLGVGVHTRKVADTHRL